MRWGLVLGVVGSLVASACSPKGALLTGCQTDSDCASGFCALHPTPQNCLSSNGCYPGNCEQPTGTSGSGTTTGGSSSSSSGAVGCTYPTAAQLESGSSSWRDQCDAGTCTDYTQCAAGYYCDFTVDVCTPGPPNDIGVIVPGSCRLRFESTGLSCNVGEDCGGLFCFPNGSPGSDTCTLASPCKSDALCEDSTSPPQPGAGGTPPCPADCPWVAVPQTTGFACICSGTACDAGA